MFSVCVCVKMDWISFCDFCNSLFIFCTPKKHHNKANSLAAHTHTFALENWNVLSIMLNDLSIIFLVIIFHLLFRYFWYRSFELFGSIHQLVLYFLCFSFLFLSFFGMNYVFYCSISFFTFNICNNWKWFIFVKRHDTS